MTRSELMRAIYNNFPHLLQKDSVEVVKVLLDEITAALANGRRIEVRGFGSFRVHYRKGRVGRNPRTGQLVQVEPKYVPRFRASRELQNALIEQPLASH